MLKNKESPLTYVTVIEIPCNVLLKDVHYLVEKEMACPSGSKHQGSQTSEKLRMSHYTGCRHIQEAATHVLWHPLAEAKSDL